MSRPLLVMLGGPNGAGKSTFYHTKLAHLKMPFLNADILAEQHGLSAYEAAAEIARMRDELRRKKHPFITETVLSDPVGEKVGVLKQASKEGYDVRLIFIGIDSPEISAQRVKQRVEAGGHDVPRGKLLARYERTMVNLERAIRTLPWVNIYDNGDIGHPHRLIAQFRDGKLVFLIEGAPPTWARQFLSI